jgi:hypothetical protein
VTPGDLEIARVALEYLKAILSVQVVVGVVVMLLVCMFRSQIKAKLDQLLHLEAPGVKVDFQTQALAQAAELAPAERERIAAAEGAASAFAKLWIYERAVRVIFQSQILLLRHLRGRPNGTEKKRALEQFYWQSTSKDYAGPYTYDLYLGFLASNGFVTIGPPPDPDVSIAPNGRGFLDYIDNNPDVSLWIYQRPA